MKKSLRSLCAVTTISLCAMGNLFAVDNNYFNSVYMIDQKQSLVQEWDKVFPQSDKVHHMKVTFRNRYGIILAADMYIPRNAEGKLPAIAVSGPFGAVKEQASGLYAQALAERGFLTIAFDPSYTGESDGEPRYVASPILTRKIFVQQWIFCPFVTMWMQSVLVFWVFADGVVWHSMQRLSIPESRQRLR